MTLGDRIRTILKERQIKQVEFAKALGISANYVNLLVNDKKNAISEPLAKLIEETYGYSALWVSEGKEEKIKETSGSANKTEVIRRINKMSEEEVRAVLAYAKTLESIATSEVKN